MTDISFKDYGEEDFSDLKEMACALYGETSDSGPAADDKIINTVNESVSHPEKLRIIMIREGGVNIGYGIIVFFWSNEYGGDVINIDELYIKKEYRNRRMASRFIESQIGLYKNAVALELEAAPGNNAALSLYRNMGFEASGNIHLICRTRGTEAGK